MATREDKRAKDAAGEGLDPRELEACLETLGKVDTLPIDHPDAITLQRATAKLYMNFKKRRRRTRRQTISATDRAVLERTATAAPGRIDDETQGHPARLLGHRRERGNAAARARPATSASSATRRSTPSTTSSARRARPSTTSAATRAPT